jgi:hypothetical protein
MESVGLHGPAQPVTFSAVPVQAGPLFPYSFLAGICSGSIKEEALTKVAVVIWDDEVHCNKVLEVVCVGTWTGGLQHAGLHPGCTVYRWYSMLHLL